MKGWEIYWITRMDGIKSFFFVTGSTLCCLMVFFYVTSFLIFNSSYSSDRELKEALASLKACYVSALVGLPLLIISCFIPTTKEMAAITVLPKISHAISENEALKKLPNNIAELATDWVEKLKPSVTK